MEIKPEDDLLTFKVGNADELWQEEVIRITAEGRLFHRGVEVGTTPRLRHALLEMCDCFLADKFQEES